MGNNHEVRFSCSKGEKDLADNLFIKLGAGLKKTYFYKLIFIKGARNLTNEVIKEKPTKDIISDLIK